MNKTRTRREMKKTTFFTLMFVLLIEVFGDIDYLTFSKFEKKIDEYVPNSMGMKTKITGNLK